MSAVGGEGGSRRRMHAEEKREGEEGETKRFGAICLYREEMERIELQRRERVPRDLWVSSARGTDDPGCVYECVCVPRRALVVGSCH